MHAYKKFKAVHGAGHFDIGEQNADVGMLVQQ